MKVLLLALAVFSASVSGAVPDVEARYIDGLLVVMIEEVSQHIVDLGLDPYEIKREEYEFRLPVTDLLSVEASVDDLSMVGLSNIVVNDIGFSVLSGNLHFDISMPQVRAKLDSAQAKVVLGNWEVEGQGGGSLKIQGARIVGNLRVNVIGGVSIHNVNVDFNIKDIKSNLHLEILGHDFSRILNQIFNDEIPNFLNEFQDDINILLAYFAEHYVNERGLSMLF